MESGLCMVRRHILAMKGISSGDYCRSRMMAMMVDKVPDHHIHPPVVKLPSYNHEVPINLSVMLVTAQDPLQDGGLGHRHPEGAQDWPQCPHTSARPHPCLSESRRCTATCLVRNAKV